MENITESAVELSWSEPKGVNKDKDILSYQVSVKKAGGGRLFNRNAERLLVTRGNETKLTARNLEMGRDTSSVCGASLKMDGGSGGRKLK